MKILEDKIAEPSDTLTRAQSAPVEKYGRLMDQPENNNLLCVASSSSLWTRGGKRRVGVIFNGYDRSISAISPPEKQINSGNSDDVIDNGNGNDNGFGEQAKNCPTIANGTITTSRRNVFFDGAGEEDDGIFEIDPDYLRMVMAAEKKKHNSGSSRRTDSVYQSELFTVKFAEDGSLSDPLPVDFTMNNDADLFYRQLHFLSPEEQALELEQVFLETEFEDFNWSVIDSPQRIALAYRLAAEKKDLFHDYGENDLQLDSFLRYLSQNSFQNLTRDVGGGCPYDYTKVQEWIAFFDSNDDELRPQESRFRGEKKSMLMDLFMMNRAAKFRTNMAGRVAHECEIRTKCDICMENMPSSKLLSPHLNTHCYENDKEEGDKEEREECSMMCKSRFCQQCLRDYFQNIIESAMYCFPSFPCPGCNEKLSTLEWQSLFVDVDGCTISSSNVSGNQVSLMKNRHPVIDSFTKLVRNALLFRCPDCDGSSPLMPMDSKEGPDYLNPLWFSYNITNALNVEGMIPSIFDRFRVVSEHSPSSEVHIIDWSDFDKNNYDDSDDDKSSVLAASYDGSSDIYPSLSSSDFHQQFRLYHGCSNKEIFNKMILGGEESVFFTSSSSGLGKKQYSAEALVQFVQEKMVQFKCEKKKKNMHLKHRMKPSMVANIAKYPSRLCEMTEKMLTREKDEGRMVSAKMTFVLDQMVANCDDQERRASLKLAILKRYPKTHTCCCKYPICFRCKVSDHHNAMTCSENMEENFESFDALQFCPGCGVATVRSEGCDHIVCPCGEEWGYNGEDWEE